jgi:RAC serine/threonine-protein kinase
VAPSSAYSAPVALDEMEMDDMFGYEADGVEADVGGPDFDSDSEADYFSATIRYQPADEAITEDDIMEMQQQANEVEMVEDVGSLAQSLGASHLGRSLQLQAQLAGSSKQGHTDIFSEKSQKGLTVGGGPASAEVHGGSSGGIGGAMEQAQSGGAIPINQPAKFDGLGDSFDQRAPISQPRLDSFKMIKVIGKGSFGKVFLVREIKTGEMFALKVLRKDNIVKRNQVEHTKTERNVLGYVKHPFIVGLNMAFQSKDKLYFVLDYCAGGELFFHLSKVGKFPEPRARFYASEIVLAISYVHELDIIYRDLKPENVLLDARGHVRLTDFGLSKEGISSSSSGATSFCGTPEYLAPEILNRQGHGRAVDWWSLGALLYEMLTGLPPFYCRDREKLFEKIRKGHLEYPRSLSPRSVNLLRGLLTKDPRRRLGSGPNDAEDIKLHHFFADTDWKRLSKGEIAPPWHPPIQGSLDTSQFDEEFTSMPMFSPSKYGDGTAEAAQDLFQGFTFTNRGQYMS